MTVVAVFLVAVAVNYPWEMAQCPLFEPPRPSEVKLHCFLASVGDALMVLVVFGTVSLRRRSFAWITRPGRADGLLVIGTGVALATLVEWAALSGGRWVYRPEMPRLPGTGLGMLPLLQMALLPPLVFRIAGWVEHALRSAVSKPRCAGPPSDDAAFRSTS